MERLTKLNKDVNEFFSKLIRQKNYQITSMELLLLIKLNQNRNISPAEIAKKGSGLFGHLKFLINSLESKNLITVKAKGNSDFNMAINLQPKGEKISEEISKIKVSDDILKTLEYLEIQIKNEKNFA